MMEIEGDLLESTVSELFQESERVISGTDNHATANRCMTQFADRQEHRQIEYPLDRLIAAIAAIKLEGPVHCLLGLVPRLLPRSRQVNPDRIGSNLNSSGIMACRLQRGMVVLHISRSAPPTEL